MFRALSLLGLESAISTEFERRGRAPRPSLGEPSLDESNLQSRWTQPPAGM